MKPVFPTGDTFIARDSMFAQISVYNGLLYVVGGKGSSTAVNYNDVWTFSIKEHLTSKFIPMNNSTWIQILQIIRRSDVVMTS